MPLIIKPVSVIPITGIPPLPPGGGPPATQTGVQVVIPVYVLLVLPHISQMIGYGSASLHVNSI